MWVTIFSIVFAVVVISAAMKNRPISKASSMLPVYGMVISAFFLIVFACWYWIQS